MDSEALVRLMALVYPLEELTPKRERLCTWLILWDTLMLINWTFWRSLHLVPIYAVSSSGAAASFLSRLLSHRSFGAFSSFRLRPRSPLGDLFHWHLTVQAYFGYYLGICLSLSPNRTWAEGGRYRSKANWETWERGRRLRCSPLHKLKQPTPSKVWACHLSLERTTNKPL